MNVILLRQVLRERIYSIKEMNFSINDVDLNGSNEIDYDDIPYPNVIWYRKEDWEIAVKSAALLPIVLCGISANAVVLILFLRNKPLRTPTNYLFVNMATADMAALIISPWMFLCRDIFQNYELGEIACKTEGFIEFSLLLTDVFTLMAISYNRLMAIVRPHEALISCRNVLLVTIIAWIFGIVFASPLIFFRSYKERQWEDFLEKYCNEDTKVLPLYWNVIITMMIWIPLCVLLFSYTLIFRKLDRYVNKILTREQDRAILFKKRAAKIMFIVILVFIACRIPFTALVFWRSRLLQLHESNTFGDDYQILWFTSQYLMFTNAALNPIIYGFTNRNLQSSLQKSTLCGRCFAKIEASPRPTLKKRVWTVGKIEPRRVTVSERYKKYLTN